MRILAALLPPPVLQGEHLPREVLDGIAARLQPRLQSFGPQVTLSAPADSRQQTASSFQLPGLPASTRLELPALPAADSTGWQPCSS
jgi:hypothetical protein